MLPVELLARSATDTAVLVICDYLFTVALRKRLNYEIITLAACACPFQLLNRLTDFQKVGMNITPLETPYTYHTFIYHKQ
jgi:hypothetical protein